MRSRELTTRVHQTSILFAYLCKNSRLSKCLKRIAFADFLPGVKEDYVEGLKVFDKEGTGKVPLPEVQNVLCSLGEKLEQNEATKLCELLGIVADEEDNIAYMDFIDKLLAATA